MRFLGTTQESSNTFDTLKSICSQITVVFGLPKIYKETPKNFSDVKTSFHRLINSIKSKQRLVIVLDSLACLSSNDGAHDMTWLPAQHPQNVKIIVSCNAREDKILKSLEEMKLKSEQCVELTPLDVSTAKDMIKFWLRENKRGVTSDQLKIVDSALHQNTSPLYISLIFNHIVKWHAYERDVCLPKDVADCINDLLKNTERKHGQLLVSHALALMHASKEGLTDGEVEDILSLDDEVLNEAYQHHNPPLRRLPSILWSRIRSDLADYIVEREADGAKVLAWEHLQFEENATERYVK